MTQKMSAKQTTEKKEVKQSEAQTKTTTVHKPQPEKSTPKPEAVEPKLSDITATILEHTRQISELQEALARKRKAVPNGKVQIKDKQTGKVYPSKNNCYQTMLKAGELKDLVDAGVFGADPVKNTFGWYALVRALPDRFEELITEQSKEQA